MKSGLNFVLDGNGEQCPIILLSSAMRDRAANDGYVHNNKLYLKEPRCVECGRIDANYEERVEDMLYDGDWIILAAEDNGGSFRDNALFLLEECDFMLLPVVAPTRADAIDKIFSIIEDLPQLNPIDPQNKVHVCEVGDLDFVCRIERKDEKAIYLWASYYDDFEENDRRREEVAAAIFETILSAFQNPALTPIELEDDEPIVGSCPKCGFAMPYKAPKWE